jgi:hypothetical protein
MSLAHFDDISDICYGFEKDQQFGNEFRLRDARNEKNIIKPSALSEREILPKIISV